MPETAVSDTGPIIHLNEIEAMAELSQFEKIIISDVVRMELQRHNILAIAEQLLSDIFEVHKVGFNEIAAERIALFNFKLHHADLSVTALTSRLLPDMVLTDDLALRKALQSRECLVVGSIGILFLSFRNGRLSKDELCDVLERLFDDSSLYLSQGLKKFVLARLNSL